MESVSGKKKRHYHHYNVKVEKKLTGIYNVLSADHLHQVVEPEPCVRGDKGCNVNSPCPKTFQSLHLSPELDHHTIVDGPHIHNLQCGVVHELPKVGRLDEHLHLVSFDTLCHFSPLKLEKVVFFFHPEKKKLTNELSINFATALFPAFLTNLSGSSNTIFSFTSKL